MTAAELTRMQRIVQGFYRRRAQALRAAGHGGCRPIGELIKAFVASSGLAAQARHAAEVAEAWGAALAAVAPKLTGKATFLAYRRGTVYVDCPSAPHLAELRTFHQAAIAAAMRARLPKLTVAAIVAKPKGSAEEERGPSHSPVRHSPVSPPSVQSVEAAE